MSARKLTVCINMDNDWSYDLEVATKEWSIAEKNLTPLVGIKLGPPG